MRSAPTFPYCHKAKVGAARTIYQRFTSHSRACGFCELVENQFLEGLTSLWTALARRLPCWFASIFIGCAAKNREPTTASLQNLGVFPDIIADQEVFSPRKQG